MFRRERTSLYGHFSNQFKSKPEDIDAQVGGAVILHEEGQKKILALRQNKKKEELLHPYLKEKIACGLFF